MSAPKSEHSAVPLSASRDPELLRGYLDSLLQEISVPLPEPLDRKPPSAPPEIPTAFPEIPGTLPEARENSGLPDWAETPFQALLFYLYEVPVAVPLIRLYGVIPWSAQIAAMPNSPDWYLGLLPHRGSKVRVVDTARLILRGRDFDTQQTDFKHIVLVDNAVWGLACHNLGEVLKLQAEQVKWRTQAAGRPWLAGMVKQQLCALLDVERLVDGLARGVETDLA